MAKPTPKPAAEETEIPVTLMRKVGPERFDVVTGVVRGVFTETKTLDRNGSLTVARGFARKSLEAQFRARCALLGLSVES